MKKEGFWSNTHKPEPNKVPSVWAAQFVALLDKVEARASERGYKGSAKCRICGQRNGSTEFTYKGWVWPAGFRHYIVEHGVKPSEGFIIFVEIGSRRQKIRSASLSIRARGK